jgi:hypothetical protein
LALLAPTDPAWPNELTRQGFRLHLIEGLVQSTPQTVRADVIAYRRAPDLVLLIECKSGTGIEVSQARAYTNASSDGLARPGSLPAELRDQPEVEVRAIFAGRDEHRDALAESLAREGIEVPLLTVGADGATLSGVAFDGLSDFNLRDDAYGLPPGLVLVDHESPPEEIRELLAQTVQAAMAQNAGVVDLRQAAHEIHPYFDHVSPVAQNDFLSRLKEAARSLAHGDFASDVQYEGTNQVPARLVLLSQPSSADPRGAPQAWRRVQRNAEVALGRRARPEMEGQMSLSFDDEAATALGEDEDSVSDE